MQLLPKTLIRGGRFEHLPQILKRRWRWLVAGTLGLGVAAASIVAFMFLRVGRDTPNAALTMTSDPSMALVEVDGRKRGETPLTLALADRDHEIVLHHAGYADSVYNVTPTAGVTTTLHADLWLRSPRLQRLRPALPGAAIVHADFLVDGRIALILSLPPSDERQIWIVSGTRSVDRIGPPNVHGSIAVSPNAQRIAYAVRSERAGVTTRLDEVWIAQAPVEQGDPQYSVPTKSESIIDLAWARDGEHLLVVSRETITGGGVRTHLRWLMPDTGEAKDLVSLPSDIVPGSFLWSSSGQWVAFLTQSGSVPSLCLLEIETGRIHYLADVASDDTHPLPIPPLAWSPDGERLLYAALTQERSKQSGWLVGPRPKQALFLGSTDNPAGQRLGDVEAVFPVWRNDDSVLAFAGAASKGTLTLRAISTRGTGRDVGDVPLDASAYAVRWDPAHAQALIAMRPRNSVSTTNLEYWLAGWQPEEAR
ncbi:MAG: PEGA domain-containing protein [Anaerolineae bacterium]